MMRNILIAIGSAGLGAALALLVTDRAPRPGDPDAGRRTALVTAVERVAPTVVSITAVERRGAVQPFTSMEELYNRQLSGDLMPLSPERMNAHYGSGFIIDANGFFLTNEHVVGSADTIAVTLPDGREFGAVLVGSDATYDLAVIRVADQRGPVFDTSPIGPSDSLLVGEWVVAVGTPHVDVLRDRRPSVTAGVISAIHRDVVVPEAGIIFKDMIQTDAAINPGNSGGPLVNAAGEVIGINTFIISRGGAPLGLNFAIPIATAMQLAGDIILYGRVRGVWTGIMVRGLRTIPRVALDDLGITDLDGVVVWTMETGSPADQAGLRLGDIIRALDGQAVRDEEEAALALFGSQVGDTVTFTVERRGRRLDVPVVLEARPGELTRRGDS